MAYLPPLNGGRINATIGGNTAGASTLISTGTMTLAGGNNITLSQNGNAITISGAAGGAGGINTLGMSNLGNTSGTSGVVTGSQVQFAFAGGNNITLSQSINASSGTITISAATQTNQTVGLYALGNTTQNSSTTRDARSLSFNGLGAATVGYSNGSIQLSVPTQTTQTQNLHNMTLSGNTAGVMAQVSSGTLTLAGGNNITLSQNGNAVTISGVNGAAGINSMGMSNLGNTSGTSGIVTGSQVQFAFAGGNNVTLSQSINGSSGTITISAATQTVQTQNLYNMTLGGNTDGVMAQVSSGTLTLAGGDNITLSQNGNAVTISGGAGGGGATYSYFNPQDAYIQITGQQGNGTLHMQPMPAPNVTFDRAVVPILFSGATNSTASITLSLMIGIYTRNASSLSLSTSFTTAQAITHSGTANSSQNVGLKMVTLAASHSLSEGMYYAGIISRTSSGGANATISQILASQQNSNLAGIWGVASAASVQYTRGLGVMTASSSALPASVAFSQLNGTASLVLRQPLFYVINGTI